MEGEWIAYLMRHFPEERWTNYYHTIMYYTMAVDLGLKPSFMWDFGPRPTNATQVTAFIQELKQHNIISKDIMVILLRCRVFVAHVQNLLQALEQNILVIDITTSSEGGWYVGYKNDFIVNVAEHISETLIAGNFQQPGRVTFDFKRHFPTVYGLMLGYPFTYYTEQKYPPISFHLRFYRVICKFRLVDASEDFPLYVFSVPKSLVTPAVVSTVNAWFERLKSRNRTDYELVLDHWEEHFDAPHFSGR